MKKQTNCPNCGAPIDISRSSCEYCGTPYEKEVYLVEAPSLRIDYQPEFNDYGYEAFLESLSKRSNRWFRDYSQIYQSTQASQQQLLSNVVDATAWQLTEEQKLKIIEDSVNSVKTVMDHYDQELKTISYKADRETLTLLFAALFGVVVPIVLTAIVNFIF